ncbi:MAG: translation initiation factor [Pyramidobacter sp.]|nr:translation initiation factor [Pyramidobacter sp.]
MARRNNEVWTPDDSAFTLAQALGVENSESEKKAELTEESSRKVSLKSAFRISIERKGRGGKTVTKLTGVDGSECAVQCFMKELKKSLGCGASCEDSVIYFQGDQRARLAALLASKGAGNVKSS